MRCSFVERPTANDLDIVIPLHYYDMSEDLVEWTNTPHGYCVGWKDRGLTVPRLKHGRQAARQRKNVETFHSRRPTSLSSLKKQLASGLLSI
jgi:hypothetical protein